GSGPGQGAQSRTAIDRGEASDRRPERRRTAGTHRSRNQGIVRGDQDMKDMAEQEIIEIGDLDVEAFNEFATEQGWSDGMPLYVPTEEKVAKFVETVRGDNRPYAPVPRRQIVPTL